MGLSYTLRNQLGHAATATVVLVPNRLDSKPTAPCKAPGADAPDGEPASFVYYPWQYLNPSADAHESFYHDSGMSVVVRKSDPSGQQIRSRKTPVTIGGSYVLAIGADNIVLQALRANTQRYVEIVTPPASLGDGTVKIEWYLGGSNLDKARLVAATVNVGPGTRAFFQPDPGALLFLAVASDSKSDNRSRPYAVDEARAATVCPYMPPSYATEVQVAMQPAPPAASAPVRYLFNPPKAVHTA
ncbi:hypothetical protein FHW58_001080 [Duganella sp. 1224]|uniref:hypothetical protein n=1 Tax=Duganella sp. 1224 TaxID=2587052 RepID=UPI0015CAAC96|nr:hypothetical protein [Duganella sp. 1224]NYE59928.1 hypothetical protein [Duganella sp. 1224]